MTVLINADTIVGGAVVTADASGQLGLQAAGVTKLTVSSAGVTLASALPIASGGTGTTSTTFANLTTNVTGTLPIANGGTNGTATPTANGVVYGTGTTIAYTAAGTTGQVLTATTGSAPTWATAGGLTLGTPVATTSGTSIDFTGIPAGTKQIIITFNGVSTTGTDRKIIQLGDSGGIETTGYDSVSFILRNSNTSLSNDQANGFTINSNLASDALRGSVTFTLQSSSAFTWVAEGGLRLATDSACVTAGSKALTATLTSVRITTAAGTDTFDAGSINIAYM